MTLLFIKKVICCNILEVQVVYFDFMAYHDYIITLTMAHFYLSGTVVTAGFKDIDEEAHDIIVRLTKNISTGIFFMELSFSRFGFVVIYRLTLNPDTSQKTRPILPLLEISPIRIVV